MRHLDSILRRGEEVRARADLGGQHGIIVFALIMMGILAFEAITSIANLISEASLVPNWAAWTTAVIIVGSTLLLIASLTGFLSMLTGGARLLVTRDRVLWWTSPLGLTRRSLPLSRVITVTGYMGDSLLVLHLTDGEDLRLRYVDGIESVVRALGTGGQIWRPGKATDISTRLGRYDKISFLGITFAALSAHFLFDSDKGIWPLPTSSVFPLSFAPEIVVGSIAYFFLYGVLRHFVAARSLDHRALQYFACSRLDRAYQGREPWPESGGAP